MRRAPRTDANQADVVAALRTRGALVQSLAGVGAGVPDLLVGWRGALWLLEVKTPKGKLTLDQADWLASGWGHIRTVTVVYGVDDALQAIGAI